MEKLAEAKAHMFDGVVEGAAAVLNLETPLTDVAASPFSGKKSYVHYSDIDKAPAGLLCHNLRAVALANNHSFDFGAAGFAQTPEVLERSGIPYFGAGRNGERAGQPLTIDATIGAAKLHIAILAFLGFLRLVGHARGRPRYGRRIFHNL